MKNKGMLLLLVLFAARIQFAQQEAMISQYMYSGLYINPAFSGSRNYGEVNGIFRKQWVNFEGAPVTQILSAEAPVTNKNMGWGAVVMNDKIGVSYRTDVQLSYAYQIKTGKSNRLALGLRGGMSYLRANVTELRVWDAQDQVFSSNLTNAWLPNAGAGMYFYGKKFNAGFSCPNLFDYSTLHPDFVVSNHPRIVPHYYFSSAYFFETDREFNFRPSVLIKYVPFAPVQADLNLMAEIKNKLFLGMSYRTQEGIVAVLQMVFAEKWKMGYAYDYPLTKINRYAYGSHELMLSYRIKTEAASQKSVSSF
jgi:type IX secretion system PorP/SprF family membrane protein